MKKQVALIYTGQIRTNPLSPHPRGNNNILQSLKEYFLNDEFKEEYDYDVFVSTDHLDIQAANEFFENRLVNVALWEESKYLHPISYQQPFTHDELYAKFLRTDFQRLGPHSNQYHQYYRAFLAYQMVRDHQKKYDYFIKIRPDLRLQKSILPIFQELENGKKAFMEHNLFSVASFELIDVYSEMALRYGEFHVNRGDGGNSRGEYPNFCPMNCNIIKFSSEMQETNCFYDMLEKLGYNSQEHFFGSIYNSPEGCKNTYCTFVR
jgi:hypothetical protein